MIDKTQRLNESLDSFLTEYKEKNEGNKYRPVAVGRYGIRTRESIYSKELAKDYSKNKLIFKNTLTVGMGSTQIDIGVLSEDATYAVSPAYHTYRIHDINSDYLRYCLECRNQDMFVRYVKRGSRQGKSIDLKRWITYKIPVYPESVQAEIVKRLDSVKAILSLREQELNALDDLIKARFVEMFGDPAINPMNWDKVNISEVVGGKISNGFFAKRDDYADDGNVSVMGVAYVVNRMYSQWQDLPKTNGTDKDIEKFEVKYGDMLFCRSSLVAEGIGKASIVPEGVPNNTLFECHVIRFPLDLNKCVPEYMQVLSTTEFFRQQIIAQSKTATMTTIGQDGILKADIILPPLEKQKEFYAFVKQVDKSKATVQKALDETQLLFDSLMQQYFG